MALQHTGGYYYRLLSVVFHGLTHTTVCYHGAKLKNQFFTLKYLRMLIPFQNDHADGALMHRSENARADFANPLSKSRQASRRHMNEPRDQVVDNNEDFPIDVSKTDSEVSVGAEDAKGAEAIGDSPSSKKLGPSVGLNVMYIDEPKFSLSQQPPPAKPDSPSGLNSLLPQFLRKPTEKSKSAKEFAFDNAMLPKQTVFTQERYAVQSAENKISQFAFQNVMNSTKPPSKHEKFLLQKEAVSAGIHVPIIGVSNPALFSDELSQKKGMLQMTKPAAPFHKPPPARDLVEIQRPISDGKSSKFETHQQVQNRLKSSMQMIADTPKLGVKKYVEGVTPIPNAPMAITARKVKTSADLPASRPQAYLVPKKDLNSFSSAMSPVKELGSNPLFMHKHPPPAKLTL